MSFTDIFVGIPVIILLWTMTFAVVGFAIYDFLELYKGWRNY